MNGLQEMIEWLEFQIQLNTKCMADCDFSDDLYKRLYSNRETYRDCLDHAYRLLRKLEKEVK